MKLFQCVHKFFFFFFFLILSTFQQYPGIMMREIILVTITMMWNFHTITSQYATWCHKQSEKIWSWIWSITPIQVSFTISVHCITKCVLRVIHLHKATILLLLAVQAQKPFIRTNLNVDLLHFMQTHFVLNRISAFMSSFRAWFEGEEGQRKA